MMVLITVVVLKTIMITSDRSLRHNWKCECGAEDDDSQLDTMQTIAAAMVMNVKVVHGYDAAAACDDCSNPGK